MIVDVQPGVVGQNGVSWGNAADGSPVLLIQSPQAVVRLQMTPGECLEFGTQAIYMGFAATLAAGGNDRQRPASLLFRPDGSPL